MYPVVSNVWVLGVLFFVLEDALSNEEILMLLTWILSMLMFFEMYWGMHYIN